MFRMAALLSLVVIAMTGLQCTHGEEIVPPVQRNHLADQKSPYLLQHADNPIDWYPWGEEAFARAQKEDKPIFLSIGYSACHWCHVMEEESFEDEEVAGLMNRHFVAIKVDREERPDIDHIYMTACQAMTGSGGWPLTIIMTAQGQPFFTGTYFPRESKYGRPGLLEVLKQVADLWQQDRRRLRQTGRQMAQALQSLAASSAEGPLTEEILHSAYGKLRERFDSLHGGFGEAPKFPTAHHLTLLLRWWRRHQQGEALDMVEKTLQSMRAGGIYDHLGFGFHRYATDSQWLVPHFEKMLYDQALLSLAYLEAFQVTGQERYAQAAREIFSYVLRDMTSPEGGFYSAEDADSEGGEGRYYVWRPDQIGSVLGREEGALFGRFFGVTAEGNFEDGASVLHRPFTLEEFAERESMSPRQLERFLETSRQKLLVARRRRVPPLKDDKILTDWNGLMIAALARGAWVLEDEEYARAAQRASDFLFAELRDANGRLLHRYRDGQAAIAGFLDDYAFLLWGLIELYEATFQARYLEEALGLARHMEELFWDAQGGGFFLTAVDGEPLLMRPREVTDGAVPSGNSVAALNLLRLGRLTARSSWEDRAREAIDSFAAQVAGSPGGFSHLLMALDFALGPAREVVIAGDPQGQDTRRMLAALRGRFLPNAVVLLHGGDPGDRALEELIPAVRDQVPVAGQAAAYVCRNFACRMPVTDAGEMMALIQPGPRENGGTN